MIALALLLAAGGYDVDVDVGAATLSPLALLEIDARLPLHTLVGAEDKNAVEGEAGFAIPRARLGGRGVVGPLTLTIIGEGAREKVGLLEAWAAVDVAPGFTLTAGLARTPLFLGGPEALVAQPFNERSSLERTLWPERELGVELHARPTTRFVRPEAWLRIGNGQPNALLGNDNDGFAADGRVDVVVGDAARAAGRAGVGARVEVSDEEVGVTGTTPLDFAFWRPPPVSGPRAVVEGHALGFMGPVRAALQGGWAVEGRARDDDGDPETPKKRQPALLDGGVSAELAWMIVGAPRAYLEMPGTTLQEPAVEVAVRVERTWLGLPAPNDDVDEAVVAGGANVASVAATWFINDVMNVGLQVHGARYDTAPIEDADRASSLIALLRFTVALR